MKRLRSSGAVSAINPSGSVDVLQQITDLLRGIQTDVSQVITEYNAEVYATLGTLPIGRSDPRWNFSDDSINAKKNSLDGANFLVDTNATSTSNGGRFWSANATEARPKTVKESLLALYTEIANSTSQLRTEMNTTGASTGGITGILQNIQTGRLDYTLPGAAPGSETVVGQFAFDASKVPTGGVVKLHCMINPTFSGAGQVYIHIDDIGAPGAAAAAVRITNTSTYSLGTSVSGQDLFETVALTLSGGPGVGQLAASNRMYEVVVYMAAGTIGDTVDVGFAGLYTEVI